MNNSKDEILVKLKKELVDKWRDQNSYEDNIQWAFGVEACSRELWEFIVRHIDDIRLLENTKQS